MSVAAWIVTGLLIWLVLMLVGWAFLYGGTRFDKDND
jgi:hypothetical protein